LVDLNVSKEWLCVDVNLLIKDCVQDTESNLTGEINSSMAISRKIVQMKNITVINTCIMSIFRIRFT
jgi:hypothetical protein